MADPEARQGQSSQGLAASAAVLGLGYAVLNLYWALGGGALRAQYGSHLIGQAGVADAQFRISSLALSAIFITFAAAGPRAVKVDWDSPSRPMWRWASWTVAGLLTLYGLGLTCIGFYVRVLGSPMPPYEGDVQRWHALFWDPWFLLWGVVLVASLLRSARAYVASGRDLRYVTG